MAVKDGVSSVGILADLDARLDEMGAQRALGNLQPERLEPHAIVVADVSIFLNAQDLGQIDAGDRDESAAFLFGRDREAGVVSGDVDIADEGVGALDIVDAGERQLLRQPVLQGMECALRAPARLG